MAEAGWAPEWLQALDWEGLNGVEASQEQIKRIADVFEAFFATKTKQELFDGRCASNAWNRPRNTIADLSRTSSYPPADSGSMACHRIQPFTRSRSRFSEGNMEARGRAPVLGQDNVTVYQGELGLSADGLAELAEQGVV